MSKDGPAKAGEGGSNRFFPYGKSPRRLSLGQRILRAILEMLGEALGHAIALSLPLIVAAVILYLGTRGCIGPRI